MEGRRSIAAAYLLAVLAVLPLLIPEWWVGYRLGASDSILSVIAPTEQPLSIRSPGGVWAVVLCLSWFGLAYWRRQFSWWEAALVVVGGGAALLRAGNLWLDAVAMVLPLAHQLSIARIKPVVRSILIATGVSVAVLTFVSSRPPELPLAAIHAALAASPRGKVLVDWRWAGVVQQQLGAARPVWAGGGLGSESTDFWLDYLRVAQGHERWAAILLQIDVDVVVLDAASQQRQAADLVRTSSADWHVLYDENGAMVAERVAS